MRKLFFPPLKDTPMLDELTTTMHSEFIGGEIPTFDLKVMGVYGATNRGESLESALERYGITPKEYWDNVERVLNN